MIDTVSAPLVGCITGSTGLTATVFTASVPGVVFVRLVSSIRRPSVAVLVVVVVRFVAVAVGTGEERVVRDANMGISSCVQVAGKMNCRSRLMCAGFFQADDRNVMIR